MQIFLSSLLILAHLLCLSLPATGAALDDNSIDPDAQISQEVAGGPDAFDTPDTTKGGSWTSFLNPSHIIESIQDATQAFKAPKLPFSDFWEMTKEYEKTLEDYVPHLLGDASEFFKSTNFTDITYSMHHIVNVTATFHDNIQDALDAHHITFDTFLEELEGVFVAVVDGLEKIPPPNKAPGHAERLDMVDKVLDDIALALINLATRYGIDEEVVTTYILTLKPHVQALIVTVGDIDEQYPELRPILVSIVVVRLIPQSWILTRLLRVIGFGPAGPVKGSIAAWLQSRFWGAAVKPGSWFSLLQKAAMGI